MKKYLFITLSISIFFLLSCANIKRISQNQNIKNSEPKRYALVIGNETYSHYKKNIPAKKDAELLYKTLLKLKFSTDIQINTNYQKMRLAIDTFINNLKKDTSNVGLFYYTGKSFQINNNNIFVPVEIMIKDESDFKNKTIDLKYLLNKLKEANNSFNIIILDVSRTNPFNLPVTSLNQLKLPKNTFIIYSLSPGNSVYRERLDEKPFNTDFAIELSKAIQTRGLSIQQIDKRVRNILYKIDDQQVTWSISNLNKDFFLNK